MFAAAVGLTVLPVRSMKANQELLAETDRAVEKVEEHRADEAAPPLIPVEKAYPLYQVEQKLLAYEQDSTPIKLQWGMYQGDALYPPTELGFGRIMREELVVPMMDERKDMLRRFASRYANPEDEPPSDESNEAFDALRMYLLLAGPIQDYRTNLSEERLPTEQEGENKWLAEQLELQWARGLMVADEGERDKMTAITTAWVRILRANPELELELDEPLIKDVREVLKRSDRTEAWLAEIIATAPTVEGVRDVGLRDIVTTTIYKNDNTNVRAAFTRPGWEKYARDYLSKPLGAFVGREWVLGLTDQEAREREMEDRLRLRSRYFAQYIQEWDRFIAKIYIDAPSDLVGSLTMFQDLTRGPEPPLLALMTRTAWHTNLKELKPPSDDPGVFPPKTIPPEIMKRLQGGDLAPGADKNYYETNDVARHFQNFIGFGVAGEVEIKEGEPPPPQASLQVDKYQEQLQAVRDALQARIDDPAEQPTLVKKMKTAVVAVRGQVGEQHEQWRQRFDRLLLPPFDALRTVVEGGEREGIGGSWCSTVYQPWQEQVASKYPFNPKGYDIPLSEFSNWFKPDAGPVWTYYTATLASRIEKNGNVFKFAERGKDTTLSYNPQLPDFLTDVGDLGYVVFPPGSDKPKFEFEVQIDGTPGVSEITLAVDGKKVTYRNGPQNWESLVWPGEGDPGAKLTAKGLGRNGDVTKSGEWGFWRLLGEANVTGSAGQTVYSIKWDLTDQGIGVITIRLKPKRGETPLFGVPSRGSKKYLGLFSGLKVPRFVVNGYSCSEAAAPAAGGE
ncbi:MAG: hypothetical protein HC927_02675 [Deltaproteobacteria bacterium]|nr:hypothetical protein [Deltaproteobacteria bacterium]